MQEFTISVITIMYDNGDGGYTMYAYNNEDELIADHRHADRMTDELRQEILSGYDEYENGYLGEDRITIKVVDGVPMLAKPLSFHAGQ